MNYFLSLLMAISLIVVSPVPASAWGFNTAFRSIVTAIRNNNGGGTTNSNNAAGHAEFIQQAVSDRQRLRESRTRLSYHYTRLEAAYNTYPDKNHPMAREIKQEMDANRRVQGETSIAIHRLNRDLREVRQLEQQAREAAGGCPRRGSC